MHRVSLASASKERPRMIKVVLEWDETGQAARLQRGLVHVDGIMPVLATFLKAVRVHTLYKSFCMALEPHHSGRYNYGPWLCMLCKVWYQIQMC